MTEGQMLFVIDRREGGSLVLVDDKGESMDVRRDDLPTDCRREGAVLRVSVDAQGTYDWKSAVRDAMEENRRRKDTEARLSRLQAKDSGGDISL